MGLLGQIIGGMAANSLGRSALGGRGGGTRGVLMALLPVVLGMLANRGHAVGAGSAGSAGNASSGGLLGGIFGAGAGAAPGAGGLGGLGGLLDQFTQKGYGQHASSWVSSGANEPLTPDAVGEVFGSGGIEQIAQQAGVSPDEARSGLAELLPEVVDHFTPGGQVPDMQHLSTSVDDYLKRLTP